MCHNNGLVTLKSPCGRGVVITCVSWDNRDCKPDFLIYVFIYLFWEDGRQGKKKKKNGILLNSSWLKSIVSLWQQLFVCLFEWMKVARSISVVSVIFHYSRRTFLYLFFFNIISYCFKTTSPNLMTFERIAWNYLKMK